MTPNACWATLLTRTSYLQGALVLNQSLVKHKSAYPLVVFATKELPLDAREVLQSKGIWIRDIEYLEPSAETKGELDEHDRRFADTWTKLRCFEMVEYEVSLGSGRGRTRGRPGRS
jgi:alpha-N-acetylglucosamine transferase